MRENKGTITKRLYLSTLFSSHIFHKQPSNLIPMLVFCELQNTFQYHDVNIENIIQELFTKTHISIDCNFDFISSIFRTSVNKNIHSE